MSDFTHYERYHLYEYVYKKDRLYTKTEIDSKLDTLKTQLTTLVQNTKQTLQNEIDKLKRANEQSDPTEQNDPAVDPESNAEIKRLIQSGIGTALNKYHKHFIKIINKRMKGRVGKKSLTIPKSNYTWIKLLDVAEIDGVTSLDEILIQDMYIKRTDRYHNAKSDLVAGSFDQLEFFYDSERENYYCYFNNHPFDWSMDCFFHYVKLPKQIAIEEEIEEGSDKEL